MEKRMGTEQALRWPPGLSACVFRRRVSSREVYLLCCCTRVCVYGTCLLHCQTASSGC